MQKNKREYQVKKRTLNLDINNYKHVSIFAILTTQNQIDEEEEYTLQRNKGRVNRINKLIQSYKEKKRNRLKLAMI